VIVASDHITVGERILLHLRGFQGQMNNVTAPPEVTQDGIAEVLHVTRSHTSCELKVLIVSGQVLEHVRHVPGGKISRKVYSLSDSGLKRAQELEVYLASHRIDIATLNRPTVKASRSCMIEELRVDLRTMKEKAEKMELRLKALEQGA